MTVQTKPLAVTTGAISGSRKTYSCPPAAPYLAVPFREVTLHPSAGEDAVRLYDTSGPYTDPDAAINLAQGLASVREAWIERRGFSNHAPRAVRPEDRKSVV